MRKKYQKPFIYIYKETNIRTRKRKIKMVPNGNGVGSIRAVVRTTSNFPF